MHWSERLSANSSTSSLGLQTPRDDEIFPHQSSAQFSDNNAACLSQIQDRSLNVSDNYPTISSLEVELSASSSMSAFHNTPSLSSPEAPPVTPQRAYQVFGFLTDRTKARLQDRPLPSLPNPVSSRFSSDTSVEDDTDIPNPFDTPSRIRTNVHDDSTRLSRSRSARPILDYTSSEQRQENPLSGPYFVDRARSQSAISRGAHSHSQSLVEPLVLRGPRPLPVSPDPAKIGPGVSETKLPLDLRHEPWPALGERLNSGPIVSHPPDDRFTRLPSRMGYHRKASSTASLCDRRSGTEGSAWKKDGTKEKENTAFDPRKFFRGGFLCWLSYILTLY
jgi:hypothetical protein